LGELLDPALVVLVGEERAVTAAAVAGPARDDAVAAAAEDAGPARAQPGQVGADPLGVIGRIDEIDPFAREVQAHFGGDDRQLRAHPREPTRCRRPRGALGLRLLLPY